MHDIGKIGIPDAVLNKPGPLDDKEWEIIKEHSTLGYEMLKSSKRELLQAAAIIAHEHHERYDGKGYPRGLKGEDIHIYGRILAITDVYDALSNDRVYKKKWELDKILEFFKEGKGTQFDPQLTDLFLDNIDEFEKLKIELL
jgi:putative two-component system response regulator